jgi:hypothetical protein
VNGIDVSDPTRQFTDEEWYALPKETQQSIRDKRYDRNNAGSKRKASAVGSKDGGDSKAPDNESGGGSNDAGAKKGGEGTSGGNNAGSSFGRAGYKN